MTDWSFFARNVAGYVEDEVCVVAFAETDDPDPSRYVILSQTLYDDPESVGPPDESFSVETAGIDIPPLESIDKICLSADQVSIEATDIEATGAIKFTIEFAASCYATLYENLPRIVTKSSTQLVIIWNDPRVW